MKNLITLIAVLTITVSSVFASTTPKVLISTADVEVVTVDKLDIFNATFQVDENGRGCLKNVPFGNHWLVAHGRDENWGPDGAPIRGSIRVVLDIDHFQLDSTIYVQEY